LTSWWRRGAVYQIYPRSFADSDGDGVGDLRGATGRLDHLRDLGGGAIWISPFYPSPMADFGYDISDDTGVDPLFGSLEDFDRLVEEAGRRDIKVVVDFVGNHTSDRHRWFAESRASRDSPRRDWYVWRDGRADGVPPNDWVTAWKDRGPAWTWERDTAQWYLHSFLAEQPDLNWDNPEVEAAMFDVLRFWLDRGAGGFRLDVAYKLGKDPSLADNEPGHSHQEHWLTVHDRPRRLRSVLEEYDGAQPAALRSRSTSAPLRRRCAPRLRSERRSGPNATRSSSMTGWPTSLSMRLTCRLRPSWIVSSTRSWPSRRALAGAVRPSSRSTPSRSLRSVRSGTGGLATVAT